MKIPEPSTRVADFEHLAYGLFLHWGLYSLLGRGEWVMELEHISADEYAKLADRFTARRFNARKIARLARRAGMKYAVLTTRHHDGFSLYDTRGLSDFDAPHSAAGRDLVAEFVAGCRAEGIVPFLYHTTLDWRWDSAHCTKRRFNEYLDYLHASVEVLCRNYGPLGGLWFDGNWSRSDTSWKETRLYRLIRKYQPEAIITNNTGLGARGETGHREIDSVTFEQGLPGPLDRGGWKKYVTGEMCQTMNSHWGIGKHDFNYKSPADIIHTLALCRKVGANYLLNVGPTAAGAIPEYERAALKRTGAWVKMHAKPLYQGVPVPCQCEGRDFVLQVDGQLFYFVFDLGIAGADDVTLDTPVGVNRRTIKGLDRKLKSARWMDSGQPLRVEQDTAGGGWSLDCEGYPYGTDLLVRVAELVV